MANDYEQMLRAYARTLPTKPYFEADKRDIQIAFSRGVYRRNLSKYLNMEPKTVRTILDYEF